MVPLPSLTQAMAPPHFASVPTPAKLLVLCSHSDLLPMLVSLYFTTPFRATSCRKPPNSHIWEHQPHLACSASHHHLGCVLAKRNLLDS